MLLLVSTIECKCIIKIHCYNVLYRLYKWVTLEIFRKDGEKLVMFQKGLTYF